jgi:hypothetical protein
MSDVDYFGDDPHRPDAASEARLCRLRAEEIARRRREQGVALDVHGADW